MADITYLRCWEGVLFFAFVLDAYSRRIVGWQLAGHMRTTLVLDALRMALHQRGGGADVELVHHSDRGSQYTSIDYTQTLADHGVLASVGSVGDAYDNALAESFVDSFKTELIADRVWRTRNQLELAVRRIPGLVQHRPPAPSARRRSAGRVRSTLAPAGPDDHIHNHEVENQLTRSPRNPGWLRPGFVAFRGFFIGRYRLG